MDVDQVYYFCNFDHVQLTIDDQWQCTLYYHRPCRFLTADHACAIHAQDAQPLVCRNYNPYSCFYKSAMRDKSAPTFSLHWINIARMDFLVSKMTFDETRRIEQYPDGEDVAAGLRDIPWRPDVAPGTSEPRDLPMEQWRDWVLEGVAPPSAKSSKVLGIRDVDSPCSSCVAYCCTSLVFPFPIPDSLSAVDYLKYCLGFPGIHVGISDNAWFLIAASSCRHLDGNRCGIYGRPERPLTCRYFPEQNCSYIKTIGKFRTPEYLRLGGEQLPWLIETIRFDEQGLVTGIPTTFTMRNYVEARWREEHLRSSS